MYHGGGSQPATVVFRHDKVMTMLIIAKGNTWYHNSVKQW